MVAGETSILTTESDAGFLRAHRAELERSINEIEQQIRALCKKQERALAAALAIEEMLLDEERQ